MNEKKDRLVSLIVEHNVSAIVTISEKLELEPEVVIELINKLVSEKRLHGMLTEDGTRFFRSDAKVSVAPVIEREYELPKFLNYDTRPGIAISVLGLIVLIGGVLVNVYARDLTERDFAAGLFLIGLLILFGGLILIAKRNTPD